MSAVVSPTFPSPPSKEADPCCMTGRCREFYCTNTWSLERPRWSLGVTAGSEALEPVTTEQDPVGQRRLGHKSIKFGFINVPVAFFFFLRRGHPNIFLNAACVFPFLFLIMLFFLNPAARMVDSCIEASQKRQQRLTSRVVCVCVCARAYVCACACFS